MSEKPIKKLSELPKKQALLTIMTQDQGMSVPEAAKELGYNEDYAYHINKKLSKYQFTGNIKAQKTAHRTITSLAAGRIPKGSQITEVKDSTSFSASKYITDHNDPVIQHTRNENLNLNITADPVDIQKYKNY